MKIACTPISVKSMSVNSTPAFGFAKLNELGRKTADSFGYQKNEFIDENLFKRQYFEKSALTKKLNEGADFAQLCQDYGCSNNGKSNAEFIRTQILSKKSDAALSTLSADVRSSGLKTLFENNYDNPELSKKETDALLKLVKESIDDEEYVKYSGIIKVGADK